MTGDLREGWDYARDYSQFIRRFSDEELLRILDNPAEKKKLYDFMDRLLGKGFLFDAGAGAYWTIHPAKQVKVYEADRVVKEAFQTKIKNIDRYLEG